MPAFTNNVTGDDHAIVGVAEKGIGVHGTSNTSTGTGGVSDSGIGVHGVSKAGPGVRGDTENGIGVFGGSKTSTAIGGISDSGIGVHGISKTADGVFGNSEQGRGVVGVAKAATGVEGNSTSAAGVYGSSQTGIGVHGKGGRLGGLFEGNVEITGNLTIQGVSIQLWLQRIVQLEQQVADLSRRFGSGSGTGSSGVGTQTFIQATLELNPQASGLDGRLLKISGSGFQPGEQVTLQITYRPNQSTNPDTPRNTPTTADELGRIDYTSAVTCGSDPSKRPSWQVQATGTISRRVSNVTSAGC